jgi:5-methylcytosine-specific restriction endonuclease McrA
MPNAPKHICPIHHMILQYGEKCPKCAGQRRPPEHRPTARQRGYDRRWEKASKLFLGDNPLCVECQKQGVVKAADCVDHIVPHKGDYERFWNDENWQALCVSCHARKTRRESSSSRQTTPGA